MSSRSIYPADGECPECGLGRLKPVLAHRTYTVEGRRVRVPGLLPLECDRCHERLWPESELKRGQQLLAAKLQRVAA